MHLGQTVGPSKQVQSVAALGKVQNRRDLLSLQRSFADIIRRPLEAGDTMKDDPRIEPMIEPSGSQSARERLELYSRQYWWRIRDSFDEDFSTLKSVLGEDKYREIRDRYLEENPSISFTLRNLGERLVAFMERVEIDDNDLKVRAVEAAAYDWARIIAFDAAAYAPLTAVNIQSRNFSRRILKLQPFVVPLRLSFDLLLKNDSGCLAINDQEPTSATPNSESGKGLIQPIRLRDETRFVILHRHDGKLFLKPSSRNEHFLLSSFLQGSSLINIFSVMATGIDITEGEIYSFFESWVRMGWLYCESL
jgi:hypothetical protein